MSGRFKKIVIGRGMMGASAARHLAAAVEGVALIGPDEPVDAKTHQGVFGAHYDEARITRTIDPNPVWALLANRSIARYDEIQRESGVTFYHEAGCLMVGPKRGGSNPYVGKILDAAERLSVETELLDAEGLSKQFGYFDFGTGCEGVYQSRDAGYVNPRRLVEAQSVLAKRAGAELIAETVISVEERDGGVVVRTDAGNTYEAEQALVAAGGFSIADRLLPRAVDLTVYARTVAFFEIPEDRAHLYAGMPSLIHEPEEPTDHIYLLPPVRYPDGKTYLKIGGDPDDLKLPTEPDIRNWFRSGGRDSTRKHLKRIVDRLIPSLAETDATMAACVTSFTPQGYPAIGFVPGSRHIAVVTGGCGAAAKSCDEIGRLGAEVLLSGGINDEAYGIDFEPIFR